MSRSTKNTDQGSLHASPNEWNQDDSGSPSNPVLYPDSQEIEEGKHTTQGLTRTIEILGSALLLILSLPRLVVILFAVERTSKNRFCSSNVTWARARAARAASGRINNKYSS